MFLRLLSAIALLTGAVSTVKNCDPASRFSLDDISFDPATPVAGQEATLSITFTNPGAPVETGTAKTSVSLNYIPLSPTEEPLCDNTDCPIVTGTKSQKSTSVWPSGVTGLVVTKIQWFDPDGASLLCMQINVNSNEIQFNSTEMEDEEPPPSHGFRLPY